MTQPTVKHYRTCNLCEAMCGLEIEHQGDKILSIKGDKNDVLSRGHICPKALALKDLHEDKDRIRQPLKRTENGWVEISWATALQEVADNIGAIQREQGNDAIGLYLGNPVSHNYGALLYLPLLFNALKTKNRYSAAFIDQMPHQLASKELFGSHALMPVPDLDRTDYFLCIGANPMASKGSVMSAGDIVGRLKSIKKRGGKIVTIDPRFTETAEISSEHYFTRPGHDAVLLAAVIKQVFANKQQNLRHLHNSVVNLDSLKELVNPFSPEVAERFTGIKSGDITRIAADFGAANSAVAYCRMGSCTSPDGGTTAWLIYCLNIITGNLDRAGGAMFTKPIIDLAGSADFVGERASFAEHQSRVRGLPEFSGEYSVSTLADEMLTPGQGQIKGFICHAGNPVLSIPNGKKMDKALSQLDYMVSIDIYLNETSRHANIILPPTSQLEHGHYDLFFSAFTVRDIAKFSPPLFTKPKGSKHDWEILLELATRLDSRSHLTTVLSKLRRSALQRLGDEGVLNLVIRLGPYGNVGAKLRRINNWRKKYFSANDTSNTATPWTEGHNESKLNLNLERLKDNPHGIDLGPLSSSLPQRLFTKDKKINLVPEFHRQQLENLALTLSQENDHEFLLIGRRDVRSCNSWLHNSQRLVKGKERCTAIINTNDAMQLNIQQGDLVELSSPVGKVKLPAEISDKIMSGVISMPHGWGHSRRDSQLSIAQDHAGVSMNDILDDHWVDKNTGMALINGVPINVLAVSDVNPLTLRAKTSLSNNTSEDFDKAVIVSPM